MRVNRRDVAAVAVSAFVVATVARLVGFLGVVNSLLATPGETLRTVVQFWRPVVEPWVVLVVLGVIVVASTGTDGTVPETRERPFEMLPEETYLPQQIDALDQVLDRADSVLQGQLEVLADTDDKAVRTVRLEVILLGAVASAAQIASRDLPMNAWIRVSGVLFVGSIVAGIFTYSASSPDLGPGPDYVRRQIPDGPRQTTVYLELLQGYDEAILHNRRVVEATASYLFLTQALLVTAIICGGIGTATVL